MCRGEWKGRCLITEPVGILLTKNLIPPVPGHQGLAALVEGGLALNHSPAEEEEIPPITPAIPICQKPVHTR
jgi:hypothetical protein